MSKLEIQNKLKSLDCENLDNLETFQQLISELENYMSDDEIQEFLDSF